MSCFVLILGFLTIEIVTIIYCKKRWKNDNPTIRINNTVVENTNLSTVNKEKEIIVGPSINEKQIHAAEQVLEKYKSMTQSTKKAVGKETTELKNNDKQEYDAAF